MYTRYTPYIYLISNPTGDKDGHCVFINDNSVVDRGPMDEEEERPTTRAGSRDGARRQRGGGGRRKREGGNAGRGGGGGSGYEGSGDMGMNW